MLTPGAAVELRNVTLIHQSGVETVHALDIAEFDVAKGEMVAVLGASGSGKTSLLNVVAGLVSPVTGSVGVLGKQTEVLDDAERAHHRLFNIGVIFQDHNLIPEFSALENVELPLRARGVTAAVARRVAESWLERVGLADLGSRRPAQLSGGQRQRVGVARGLAGDRPLLVADEPTGSLDRENSDDLFALFNRLAGDGVTVLIATHDVSISQWASRVLTMSDGKVREPVG